MAPVFMASCRLKIVAWNLELCENSREIRKTCLMICKKIYMYVQFQCKIFVWLMNCWIYLTISVNILYCELCTDSSLRYFDNIVNLCNDQIKECLVSNRLNKKLDSNNAEWSHSFWNVSIMFLQSPLFQAKSVDCVDFVSSREHTFSRIRIS